MANTWLKPPSLPLAAYWRLLHRYLAPQRSAALLMAGYLLAATGLQLSGPRVVRRFINLVAEQAPEALLLRTALLFMAVSLLSQALKVLAAYWSDRVAWAAANGLREDLAAHLLSLDASFHKGRTPGELIERVDGDVGALAGFFSSFVIQLLGSLLLLAAVLLSLLLLDPWLGLAFCLFTPGAVALLGWVRRLAVPHHRQSREASAALYGWVGEVITAGEDLRSLGAGPYALERFNGHLRNWYPVALRAQNWGSLVWMAAIVAFATAESGAYALGGGLFLRGEMPLGSVYMVVAYTAMLAQPLETLRSQMQNLQKAEASMIRVQELLAIRPAIAGGTAPLPGGALAVESVGVSFHYPDSQEHALANVSLRLAPGERLGLLGRTGSGKSTVARLLFRFYDPTGGSLRLGGVELREAQLELLRNRVGLVAQEVQLFHASLRENITIFDPAVPDSRLEALLRELGLGPWLDRLPAGLETPISPGSLSAGEAQLVALCRLFLQDPGLVILDEASGRLDPATEALLDQALSRLLSGRTAIIIAHRLATVEQVDQVLILEDGRVAEYGPRTALAADPNSRYARLRQLGQLEVAP